MISSLFTRIVHVIRETRKLLGHPGSPTGKLVSIWAKIMVLPQFVLAPLTVLFGCYEGLLIFFARFLAMHIAYEMEERVPFYPRNRYLPHIDLWPTVYLVFT